MSNYPTNNIYWRSLVVLDSSSGSPNIPTPSASSTDFSGNYYISTAQRSPVFSRFVDTTPIAGNFTIKTTFSNMPIISESELIQEDYKELGLALSEMAELEEGDEWKVETPVYSTACYIVEVLMADSFPAPHNILSHGPKSVVFNWSKGTDNLYLTISADQISALISSPERIKRRIDYSINQMTDLSHAFFSIRATYYPENPIKRLNAGTESDLLKVIT